MNDTDFKKSALYVAVARRLGVLASAASLAQDAGRRSR